MAKLISADLTNNKLCILEYTTTDGEMLSFRDDAFDAKIVSHTYTDKGIVIFEKPITRIGSNSFTKAKTLSSVVMPNSVKMIDDGQEIDEGWCCYCIGAFSGCSAITSIYLSSNIISIGCSAFAHCEKLTNISLPEGVKTIGNSAFKDNSSLTNVIIPNSVKSIGDDAFLGCINITNVTIYGNEATIRRRAFWDCYNLKNVNIHSGVIMIGGRGFLWLQ